MVYKVRLDSIVPVCTAHRYKSTVSPFYLNSRNAPVLNFAGQGKVGNSVELQVIQEESVLANDTIIRTPSSPNEQGVTISPTIDLSKSYKGKLIFDTETYYSGGTPVWVIIDGNMTKITTFNSHAVTDTVKHTYSSVGSYVVSLKVTDDDGGEGLDTKTIQIS